MRFGQTLFFPPFQLDLANEQLWQGERRLPLRPKTFAVLRYLVEHAGVLVTKDELLRAVWPAAHGAEQLPKKSVYELRRTLGDQAGIPHFVETVARRGWRFIAPLTAVPPREGPGSGAVARSTTMLVGRDAELAQLHGRLAQALAGERQVVFVTGEPGIGKTALVDAFWSQCALDRELHLARGQCVEHHGAGEAYLPVLEALARMCQGPGREPVLAVFRRHAPTWLLQMPALVDDAELEALHRRLSGAPQERMLREMAEALETLAAARPLALWLEDVQWSDYSTLDLIRCLAQRRGPARLLLVATCRTAEANAAGHPLRSVMQELRAHGQCAEVAPALLSEADVARYLAGRFGGEARGAGQDHGLARLVHQNTDGNPLFMVNVVDYLVARGVIEQVAGRWQVRGRLADVAPGVPDTLRQLIEKQLDHLAPNEQRLLEAAAVAGAEFSAVAVAAALGETRERVEESCERLARRGGFLAARGAERLSDGTVAGRYTFLHALYQKTLYERLGEARRIRLHRAIGEGLEAARGAQVGEAAAELAVHFERGREPARAVQYLEHAARNAVRRSANREAVDLLRRALALLAMLPAGPEHDERELAIQVTLAVPLMMTRGYTAPEVKTAYERALTLCRQIGRTPQIFPVVVGLSRFYYGRNAVERRNWSAESLLRLAHADRDPDLLLVANTMQGGNLFFQGEFARAYQHAEQGAALYDPRAHRTLIHVYGDDPQVLCHCWAALSLWYLGCPDGAMRRIEAALRAADDRAYPFGIAFARFWATFLHQARGEARRTQEQAEALVSFAEAQGIPQFAAMGGVLRGWALARLGRQDAGIAAIRDGMASLRTIGQELGRPYFSALLADACRAAGRATDGLAVATEALALAERTGECMHQAELYRLRGELLPNGGARDARRAPPGKTHGVAHATATVEACFEAALAVARRQAALSLELRAATSLGRWWQRHGRARAARAMLAEIYGRFTEGRDTGDLREARALLAELETVAE